MAITAKQLAQTLGLSEAAVSMALNNKPGVSTETKKLVLAKAAELGFDFSKLKDAHQHSEEKRILYVIFKRHGAVVGDTPFFADLLQGIDYGCKKHGFYLSCCHLNGEENFEANMKKLASDNCDGILFLCTELPEHMCALLENLPVPVVLLDSYFRESKFDCVLINNVQGAHTATSSLIKRYKCQPGYLRSFYPTNNFKKRSDGFYKAIRENGMSVSQTVVHMLSPSMDGAYSDMKALLNDHTPLARCYFADNDLIAIGAMKAFLEKGYRVPEDVAIIGFDDISLCTSVKPTLSSIRVAKQTMGEVAVDRLAAVMACKNTVPLKVQISTSLVKRASS